MPRTVFHFVLLRSRVRPSSLEAHRKTRFLKDSIFNAKISHRKILQGSRISSAPVANQVGAPLLLLWYCFFLNFSVKTLNVSYVILYFFFVARLLFFFQPTEFLRVLLLVLRINHIRYLCLEQGFVEEKAQCNHCVEEGDLYLTNETIIFLLIPQNNKALCSDQQKTVIYFESCSFPSTCQHQSPAASVQEPPPTNRDTKGKVQPCPFHRQELRQEMWLVLRNLSQR